MIGALSPKPRGVAKRLQNAKLHMMALLDMHIRRRCADDSSISQPPPPPLTGRGFAQGSDA
jgi:hypothetical protein